MDRRREEAKRRGNTKGPEGDEPEGEETRRVRENAEAEAREMAEAEITLEMEEAMGETFEERMARHNIGEESPARRMLKMEYVQAARRKIAQAQEESEETRGVGSKKPPAAPSAEEWRTHRLTHWPYRSWCPICVAAREVEDGHRLRGPPSEADGPEVHWDYCFLRSRPGDPLVPVLVGKDRKARCFVAHVVPEKAQRQTGLQYSWLETSENMICRACGSSE